MRESCAVRTITDGATLRDCATTEVDMNLDAESLKILCAYFEYWETIALPEADREVCYRWVASTYRNLFGGTFHQSGLRRLAKLGILIPSDSADGGNRRYYKLANPEVARNLIHAGTH